MNGITNGIYIVEKRCIICGVVNYPGKPGADGYVVGVKTENTICPECKRAVMYARELLKEKERGAEE